MAPRLLVTRTTSIVVRSKPSLPRNKFAPCVQTRFASNKDVSNPPAEPGTKGPNMGQTPHVSEEQAAIDKTMGKPPPDLEQGTPVLEILERDKDALKNAPQVLKEEMKNGGPGSGQKRSFSTSTHRRAQEMASIQNSSVPPQPLYVNGLIDGMSYPDAGPGHKFPLPDVSRITPLHHLKKRYDPVVDQLTKVIMTHGKLSQAQKNMNQILEILRTAPPPQPNVAAAGRGLLLTETSATRSSAGTSISIPRSALPLHPIEYLTTIIDSVAPLIKIRQQKGIAGGGATLPIPVPLSIRQRRRQAIKWILGAADNRREEHLAVRVAKELINVAEGKSSVWDRRAMLHRLAVSARSNVKMRHVRVGRKKKSF